ncbi:MAG: hypothetical protein OXT65_05135 [Alphaproteobacteria bacterium]|nr:hypothetical protein [Alphaproteobacteria bacterium]
MTKSKDKTKTYIVMPAPKAAGESRPGVGMPDLGKIRKDAIKNFPQRERAVVQALDALRPRVTEVVEKAGGTVLNDGAGKIMMLVQTTETSIKDIERLGATVMENQRIKRLAPPDQRSNLKPFGN